MSCKARRLFLPVLVVSIAFGLWLSGADAVPMEESSSVLPVGPAAQVVDTSSSSSVDAEARSVLTEQQSTAGDPDGDGFSNKAERYIGPDPHDACPDYPNDDAWPPALNRDTRVNVLDLLLYRPVILSAEGDANFNRRFDLNTNGIVDIADLMIFRPLIGTSCA